uniref:Foldit1 n=1 Tax=synthetic construct TaxID=32630 RepID=UPI00111186BC|nr:Chain A, Foldit1 [synthetic construct]
GWSTELEKHREELKEFLKKEGITNVEIRIDNGRLEVRVEGGTERLKRFLEELRQKLEKKGYTVDIKIE